ncbi:LytR/AlgR family response regulator transcription factor [Sphingomonas sp. Y38-1Y]|uniref:LytR/AlgR family response regulator transcription factor n=1 Tax=Sphingomonas sp. Y38-1Y TaxID=3078265 RepID=UPI0028E44BC8|nr:response regulator [Sphingomonas sp. Y38-1Y]
MPSPDAPSVLVVDDEAPARRRLTDLLAADAAIGTVRTAVNGVEAIEAIRTARPDIVFLDVQMPGIDGFGVIEAIGAADMPPTVFVTAYDRFAIQAFEVEAVDYLLKPFGDRRYEQTMARVRARLPQPGAAEPEDGNGFGPEVLKLIGARAKPGAIWDWIAVRQRDTTRLLMTEEIDWIEGAGVYVTVHAQGEAFLYRAGLAAVAERLDPFRFVRIHRSHIVNVRAIASLARRSHGEFEVTLKSGAQLQMSRTYRAGVEAILGQPL